MPILTVQTNVADQHISDEFLAQLTRQIAQLLGKPEQYVAVHVSAGQRLFFGGTNEPAALIDLESIGLSKNQTKEISRELMNFIEEQLKIKSERIFIKFFEFDGKMIGWNKTTF